MRLLEFYFDEDNKELMLKLRKQVYLFKNILLIYKQTACVDDLETLGFDFMENLIKDFNIPPYLDLNKFSDLEVFENNVYKRKSLIKIYFQQFFNIYLLQDEEQKKPVDNSKEIEKIILL